MWVQVNSVTEVDKEGLADGQLVILFYQSNARDKPSTVLFC